MNRKLRYSIALSVKLTDYFPSHCGDINCVIRGRQPPALRSSWPWETALGVSPEELPRSVRAAEEQGKDGENSASRGETP